MLSRAEIEFFEENGYIPIRGAIPREVALLCREEVWRELEFIGVDKLDSRTWVRNVQGLQRSFGRHEGHLWATALANPRLEGAIDSLLGAGRWNLDSLSCGWWAISFPGFAQPPFRPEGAWHVDGNWFEHTCHPREVALVPVMLFSDIKPRKGGTILANGSHKAIQALLAEHTLAGGLSNGEIARFCAPLAEEAARECARAELVQDQDLGPQASAEAEIMNAERGESVRIDGIGIGIDLSVGETETERLGLLPPPVPQWHPVTEGPGLLPPPVPQWHPVEVTGKAGDVWLMHPRLLHCRGTNLGWRGDLDAVRFMAHPGISLRDPVCLCRPGSQLALAEDESDPQPPSEGDSNPSPLERCLAAAIPQDLAWVRSLEPSDYQKIASCRRQGQSPSPTCIQAPIHINADADADADADGTSRKRQCQRPDSLEKLMGFSSFGGR
jgi:hypothetical protein